MDFEVEPYNRDVPDEELLEDLERVSSKTATGTVTMRQYRELGRFGSETIRRRFGSWNLALEAAGVELSKRHSIPDEELFQNLEAIWRRLGRQPRRSEVAPGASAISRSVYENRFGSWRKALQAFVKWINEEPTPRLAPQTETAGTPVRGPRQPSLRLRFRVMRRDRFTCRHCGRSPAKATDVELHVDHIVPWSKGGDTTLENLQTLCRGCNLGKSDLSEKGVQQVAPADAKKRRR